MSERPRWKWGNRIAALAGVIALVGGLPAAPAASGVPAACPTAFPTADVRAGMTGTGYTVASGTEPKPFDVEVLGVLRNPSMPVRDIIIVEATSPDIDRVGGIWAGMSGSPVYVDGRLLGAVAFGLAWGPSKVAGLTAAEDMLELLDRPAASPARAELYAQRVPLSNALRTRISRATGASADEVGRSMVRLRIPLSVSGLTDRGLRGLRHFLRINRIAAVPYAGNSVSSSETADPGGVEPGSNFAAALSYGDITYAAVGTTTVVCDGKAVAFGHPFYWAGETLIGANAAEAITVVEDPVSTPYKLARIGGAIGTVDQDRFAGIRATLDGAPRTIPVTSTTTSADTGKTHEGSTEVVFGQDVVHVSLDHLFFAILAAQDQIGEGSARMSWTLRGIKKAGGTWTLRRANMYTSTYDIAYDSIDEYHWQMHRIEDNRFEPIEFTGVSADISVLEELRQYAIAGVEASVGGAPFRNARTLTVRAGARIALRITLEPYQGATTKVVAMSVRVPAGARGMATLVIRGGQSCTYNCPLKGVGSFAEFLRVEGGRDHNNDLVAELSGGEGRPLPIAKSKRVLDRVVTRREMIALRIVR